MKVIVFLIVFGCGYAQAKDIQTFRLDWLNQQHSLVTDIRVSDTEGLVPLMETLGQLWLRRDGAVGAEVAPYIAEIIIKEPLLGFSWFSQYPDEFTEYVSQSQHTLFTGYMNSIEAQTEMKHLRQRLVRRSRAFSSGNNAEVLKKMAERLSDHIETLQVRVVE